MMPFSTRSTTCTDWRWYVAGLVTPVDSELNLLVLQLASRAGEAVTCAAFRCGAGCWRGNYGGQIGKMLVGQISTLLISPTSMWHAAGYLESNTATDATRTGNLTKREEEKEGVVREHSWHSIWAEAV